MESFRDYFAVALLMRLVAICCVLRERVAACNVRKSDEVSLITQTAGLNFTSTWRCSNWAGVSKSHSLVTVPFFFTSQVDSWLFKHIVSPKNIERANNGKRNFCKNISKRSEFVKSACGHCLSCNNDVSTLIIQGADLRNGKPSLTSCRHIVIMQADCRINI